MDVVSQLVIAALFSLHQYIPAEKLGTKYFDTTVDPVTLQSDVNGITMLAAAHETCRHLFDTGGAELDMDEDQLLGFAHTIINDKQGRLVDAGSSPESAKQIIRRVCQTPFNPQAFTRAETKNIEEFITQKIAILNVGDLNSTGSYQYFGRVKLYDRNGKEMGPLFSLTEHWIAYPEVSPFVINAVVSAEDEHFFKHDGVHLDSLVRMVYKMQTSGSDSQTTGGSTLTMQLLKNLYFNDRKEDTGTVFAEQYHLKTILRKVREWYWAKPYEKFHEKLGPGSGKRYVLENYLNLMDFGPGVRGIDQAAHVFFNKTPAELSLADAAFIASLFKAPSRYARPANYEKYTEPRRSYVLNQMKKVTVAEHGIRPITQKEVDEALAMALPNWSIQPAPTDTLSNLYVRTFAKDFLNNSIVLPPGARALESEFVTTIDSDLQKVVFDTVREKVDSYDAKRNSLSRVSSARDDRSLISVPNAQDVLSSEEESLLALRDKIDSLNVKTQILVYLGDRARNDQFKKSFYALKTQDGSSSQEVLTAAEAAVASSAKFVGQILIAELHPDRCKEKYTGCATAWAVTHDVSTELSMVQDSVRDGIIKNYLLRAEGLSPRENLFPAVIDGRDSGKPLTRYVRSETDDGSLERVTLVDAHNKHIARQLGRSFRPGHIFWITPKTNNTFELAAPKLQAAVVVMNSETGEVLANFGGYNPLTSKFFDRSRLAKRQAGSTLKPWLYYLALNRGLQPQDTIRNHGVVFRMPGRKDYAPDNFSSGGSEFVLLENAFINSQNKPALGLLLDPRFGPDHLQNLQDFIDLLTDVNIYDKETVQFIAPTALGAQELRIIDLVSSFTFFSTGKRIARPHFFNSLINGHGETLYTDSSRHIEVPMSNNLMPLFQLRSMMIKTANSGTAARLKNFPKELGLKECDGSHLGLTQSCFAGKTGTSNDSRDNWFIGFSRKFVIGVWVGYDYPASTGATGGELALPIFMDIVKSGKDLLPPIEPILKSSCNTFQPETCQ